jgi:hypothetical protein
MFSADVPTYWIDLENPEAKRWDDVIAHDKTVAGCLIHEASVAFERVPELLRWVFACLYHTFGGLYRAEIASWSEGLGISVGTATILNCAYELSHLRWPRLFGCTTGIRWVDGLGMIHVRNLDWPLATIGAATRLFRFRRGTREFVSVGVPGQVAVLSGMLPQAYSVTINWAPPAAFPTFDFGPAFLVRDTLETCVSYDEAVRTLSQTRLSTSVFFTVCGTLKDQACVIERTQREAVIRSMSDTVLVQANHHVAERIVKNNEDLREVVEGEEEFSIEGSSRRAEALCEALAGVNSPCSLEDMARVLDTPSVLNPLTCQQMIFCPRTGEIKVWRRIEN